MAPPPRLPYSWLLPTTRSCRCPTPGQTFDGRREIGLPFRMTYSAVGQKRTRNDASSTQSLLEDTVHQWDVRWPFSPPCALRVR